MSMHEGDYFIPAEHYTSREFALAERERLWAKVWQMACREEELPKVGSQFVYDICNESIIIVRSTEDRIRAFYNACPHRGRQLVTRDRVSRELVCPFHGWRFGLDGKCKFVPWAEHWEDGIDYDDIGLTELRCDTWGGFVFVNMDKECEPLEQYLGQVIPAIGPYEFENQRFRWAAAVEVNCNWKLALEAFVEAYHVQTTHAQILPYFDDRSKGHPADRHGYLGRMAGALGLGVPSRLLKQPPPEDARPLIVEYLRQMTFDVDARYSHRDISAASRVLTELPPDTKAADVTRATFDFRREAAEAAGVGWPAITLEHMAENGGVWHLFPNAVVLPQPTGSLWYRLRPFGDGSDPERCILDFWALERYAPGFAPNLTKEYYEDWRDFKSLPPFLKQDFDNLPYMQKGVKTRGFKGAVTQPIQEALIANYHRYIVELLQKNETR
jgi:phenylpropionate dioxygenase-like ring-hydroxylating dioxygenase large terminal subunit